MVTAAADLLSHDDTALSQFLQPIGLMFNAAGEFFYSQDHEMSASS